MSEHLPECSVRARCAVRVCVAAVCLGVPLCVPVEQPAILAAHVASAAVPSVRPSQSQRQLGFDGEPGLVGSVSPASYAPHFLKGPYAETWSYLFRFPNGYTLLSRLMITNRGPGDGRGAGIGLVIDPAGRVAQLVNSRPKERWTHVVMDDGVELNVANHRWVIRPPSHEIRMRSGRGRFDIHATALTDVYRPGRLQYSSDDFYDLTVLAPRLAARGTVQLPGEAPVELRDGYGIALHSYSNLDEQDQAVSWLQVHTFDSDVQISLWELTAPKEQGHQRVAISLLFEDDRLVMHNTGYDREFGDVQPDPESPHYPVPRRLTFSDESHDRVVRGEVTLHQRHRLELVDLINSGFVRFFVRRLMEPVAYEFTADYDLRVQREGSDYRGRGTGVASLQIVDDPPAGF